MVLMALMGRCAQVQKALNLAAWMCMSERLFVIMERSSAYAMLLRWFMFLSGVSFTHPNL